MSKLGLKERVDLMLHRYPKPVNVRELLAWGDDVAGDFRLNNLNWQSLTPDDLRNGTADMFFLNTAGMRAFIPVLMRFGLKCPYLVYEFDGTMVSELVTLLGSAPCNRNKTLFEALDTYTDEDMTTIRCWLHWSRHQVPNFNARTDWEASAYRRARNQETLAALRRIRI